VRVNITTQAQGCAITGEIEMKTRFRGKKLAEGRAVLAIIAIFVVTIGSLAGAWMLTGEQSRSVGHKFFNGHSLNRGSLNGFYPSKHYVILCPVLPDVA
jgi:hypothetical protein